MGTTVLRDAKLWLTNCCSLPDDIKAKIEEKFHNAPKEQTKIRWNKRHSSEIDLSDPVLKKIEQELENPKPDISKLESLIAFRERLIAALNQVRAFPGDVKEKIETKFKRAEADVEVSETSESSYGDAEDYESSYDIVELNEFVFLIGGSCEGQGSEPVSSVEMYDCLRKEWKSLEPLPVKTTACSAATITGVPAVIVFGGYGGWRALNTVQVYDFVTKKWQVIQHMRKRRWGAFAIGTEHGLVVAGGCDQGSVLKSCELYSVKRREWYTLPSMNQPRCNFAGALIGRKLIVAGGGSGFYFNSARSDVELFDGDKGTWTKMPPMKHKRYGCTAVARNKLFIVLGGCDDQGNDVMQVEVFNEQTREWSEIPPLPESSSLCRALVLQNKLLFIGADSSMSKAFAYDFDVGKWEEFVDLPKGRNGFAVANIGV